MPASSFYHEPALGRGHVRFSFPKRIETIERGIAALRGIRGARVNRQGLGSRLNRPGLPSCATLFGPPDVDDRRRFRRCWRCSCRSRGWSRGGGDPAWRGRSRGRLAPHRSCSRPDSPDTGVPVAATADPAPRRPGADAGPQREPAFWRERLAGLNRDQAQIRAAGVADRPLGDGHRLALRATVVIPSIEHAERRGSPAP